MKIITRFPSRLILAATMATTVALAGCGSQQSDKPSTSAATAKPAPAPAKPKTEPLPPGLATGNLNDIETRRSEDQIDTAFALNAPEGDPGQVRVAILLPLTGRAASAGQIILNAAELALFDSGETRVMLLPHDTRSTPEGALEAAQAAVEDGADLVLGPLFGAHVQTVAEVMQPRSVPVLAFSNDQSAAGNGAAVLGVTPGTEIRRILLHARDRGLNDVAAFLPDSPFGFLIADQARTIASEVGVNLVRITHYPSGADASDPALLDAARSFASYDSRAAALERERARLKQRGDDISKRALARLENLDTFGDPPFQAVLISEPGQRLTAIAPLLAFYDIDPKRVQLLGMSSWYGYDLGVEPSARGARFTGPDPAQYDQLMNRYSNKYGAYPGPLAALAYDAVAVAADVASRAPASGQITSDQLLSTAGYSAYYGPFRINRDGTTDRLLTILQVEESGTSVVEPAPAAFVALTN